jgi:ABC-type glycerol-3-phosphate transport system permease component
MASQALLKANRWLSRWNLTVPEVPVWLFGLVLAGLWFAPFLWMLSTSLKYPSDVFTLDIEWFPSRPTFDNYIKMFEIAPVARWMFNSVLVSVTSTALCLMFGAMAGYALARMRFPGRRFLFGLFLASLMVPTEVSIVPMLLGFIKVGWANSYQALILPTVANVFSVYIFRQFFLKFPLELEEAARMDGAGHFTIFWRIAFPLARAPLIAAAVIIFTLNWNNFLWPLLVTFEESMKTMPVGIAAFAPVVGSHTQLESYSLAMAGVTLLSLPSLILFFFLQKHFIHGIASSGLKG